VRIALTSNAPWSPTGYGVQVSELAPKIKEDGHEIAIMANYGLSGGSLMWGGIPIFGQGMDAYSNDLTPSQMDWWISQDPNRIGIGITLYDVWVYQSPQWDKIPIASWTPVDHVRVPDGVLSWFKRNGSPKWAIAMSKFGQRELLAAGVDDKKLFYAPHSFNENIFKPEQPDFRPQIAVPPDAHLTIINSANKGLTPIRKCWPEMLEAWSTFAKDKSDAYLLVWTEVSGIAQGVNIHRFLNEIKAPVDRIRFVPQFDLRQGINANVLAAAYAASDVLLMTSRGEGFGVPTIEAQACGTPVIVTDWTAQSELVGSGWKVDGQKEWDELQTGWWKVPNVDAIISALEESYALKSNEKKIKEEKSKAIEFSKSYKTNAVYDTYWKPILSTLEEEVRANAGKK